MPADGKVAIVTGAAQGIGEEYARALAADGFQVVVADLKREGAEEVAKQIGESGGSAVALGVDVSDRASTLALADEVRGMFGRADVLVNNAAIYHSMRLDPQLTVDIEYWRHVFSVNLDGALLMTQAVAPLMVEGGWGRIVNQTSSAAYMGGGGAYGCAKLALIALTQGFARELGSRGITVNAIAPGLIFTEATETTIPGALSQRITSMSPISKRAMPADLLGALRFLVGEDAGWVTGQTIVIDGGYLTRI